MRKLVHLVALVGFLTAGGLTAQEDPAAFVIRLQGDVTVRQAGGGEVPAVVGMRLHPGDEVVPASGARAFLITRTGATQQVTAPTTITEPRGSGNAEMFQRVMSTLAQAANTDVTIGGRQGMIRPIPGQTTLVAPRNAITVSTDRPTFSWTATPGQTYELMLRKVDGGKPMIFEVGSDTTWSYPDSLPALEFGEKYAWTVFVGGRRGGRPLPQQEFRVIDVVEFAELDEFKEEVRTLGLDPMSDGLFLTVVALRELGLFYDAAQAMYDLESQGGMTADLYLLKGEILATLGHEAEARAAFDMADKLMR